MFLTSLKQTCNEYLIKFSENQSAPKLENTKTSPCSPCAPNLLHVLVSWIVGYHNLCSPAQRDEKDQMMLMRMMKRIVTMMKSLMTVEKPIDDSRVQSVSCWTTGPRSFLSTCAPSFDLDADHYGESRSGDLVH